MFERAEFQYLRHRHGEREGSQRQVETLQPQCRQAEQKADREAHEPGRRQGPEIRDVPAVHHDSCGVGADPVKRTVPKRELAVETGQQVEPEDRQRIDHHLGQLEGDKAAGEERDHQRDEHDRRQRDPAADRISEQAAASRADDRHEDRAALRRDFFGGEAHTRVTIWRPKMPLGRTISTATISTKAIVSFSSRPT